MMMRADIMMDNMDKQRNMDNLDLSYPLRYGALKNVLFILLVP